MVAELKACYLAVLKVLQDLSLLSSKQALVVIYVGSERDVAPSGAASLGLRALSFVKLSKVAERLFRTPAGHSELVVRLVRPGRYATHDEIERLEVVVAADLRVEQEQ